jgi:DNA-binding HxlR family transcriptional regulator
VGLINKEVFLLVSLQVEYKLTERGKTLENILKAMDAWSVQNHQAE